ncbi:MAG: hypothetical protein GXY86_02330 [Firmicutes bacterium]|nr:hypothetical protein [Bacillota bacterium]
MEPLAALLDTTVFCGALVKPDGINMKLLKLGATPFVSTNHIPKCYC